MPLLQDIITMQPKKSKKGTNSLTTHLAEKTKIGCGGRKPQTRRGAKAKEPNKTDAPPHCHGQKALMAQPGKKTPSHWSHLKLVTLMDCTFLGLFGDVFGLHSLMMSMAYYGKSCCPWIIFLKYWLLLGSPTPPKILLWIFFSILTVDRASNGQQQPSQP